MNDLTRREAQVSDAMELEVIKNQVSGMLSQNPQKVEKFKARMLKLGTTDMLKDCTPASIISCGMQALTLDLSLEGGQGYVVKYKKVAQLDIGYKGWQVLAKRSGLSVLADAVYSCDEFRQEGFGFDVQMNFQPIHAQRATADDAWVKANLIGVIVSIREDETGLQSHKFVDRGMIDKIISGSPSIKSDFSPHNKWAEQMMIAKAIKQVLSKTSIDLSKATALNDAINIVNTTESAAQSAPSAMPEYRKERFDEIWPKWVEIVKAGKKDAAQIMSQMTGGFSMTHEQVQKIMSLSDYEPKAPIDGEVVDAEIVSEAS